MRKSDINSGVSITVSVIEDDSSARHILCDWIRRADDIVACYVADTTATYDCIRCR